MKKGLRLLEGWLKSSQKRKPLLVESMFFCVRIVTEYDMPPTSTYNEWSKTTILPLE